MVGFWYSNPGRGYFLGFFFFFFFFETIRMPLCHIFVSTFLNAKFEYHHHRCLCRSCSPYTFEKKVL
jgi:hypothetical protein